MSLLQKLIKFNKVQVLGIFKNSEEEDIYYLLQVKRKGSKIDIFSALIINSTDELLTKLAKNIPLILAIDGKGILNKKINEKDEIDINWKKNLDFQAIYFFNINANSFSFISFCRKRSVDEYIEFFQQKDFQIIDFYIGPLPAILLYPVIKENILYSNESSLEFHDDTLHDIRKNSLPNKNYVLGQQTLSKYHLPLYGAALNFFLKLPEVTKSSPDDINNEEIIYKKGFEIFGKGMLIFFLIALLASYIITGYYSSENMRLNQQNVFSNQTTKNIRELQVKKEQKLLLLSKTGQLSKQFLNFYTYKLTESVPQAIEINRLQIFPIEQEIKKNKKVEVNPNVVICSGVTVSETAFNQWLNSLKKFRWIKKFEIVSLKKDKKDLQHFELKIVISNV